ncbi:MAG: DUF2244 domain-containing protein [Pseudomonadota bacterium]
MDDAKTGTSGRFRAVLTPHRSLSNRGFLILMTFVSVVCLGVGLFFLALGAWPIMGFMGLDILLVYWAFRVNYRSGRGYETVEVTPQQLTLTRVAPSGKEVEFNFNPYWVRVLLSEWPDGRTVLRLASHGEELVFGAFLTDDERKDFAEALRSALVEARSQRAAI